MDAIDIEPEFTESACAECGKTFCRPIFRFDGKEYLRISRCSRCTERHAEEIRCAEEEERRARRVLQWNEAIPPLYRENDPNRLNPRAREVAERFDYQQDKGIFLHGDFRKGKTRCAFLILRKAHDQGRSIMMMRSIDFAKHCATQFADNKDIQRDSQRLLDRCKSVGVLLLDDLGKEKITERVETTLFDVIDDRISRAKPMLITSNFDLNSLAKRMSSDQGPAIIGRIIEFCHIVEL